MEQRRTEHRLYADIVEYITKQNREDIWQNEQHKPH